MTKGELAAEAVSDHCFLKGGTIISLKRELPELHQLIMDRTEKEEK